MRRRALARATLLVVCGAVSASAGDDDLLARLRLAAQGDSQVMRTASLLCDGIGPRLTGSPQSRRATELVRRLLTEWGLSDVRLEYWDFAHGWSVERCSVHLLSPDVAPLIATPKAWTVGTFGTARGDAIHVRIESQADLARWRGRLSKKVVFLGEARMPPASDPGHPRRFSDEDLALIATPGDPPAPPTAQELLRRNRLEETLVSFFSSEGALAVVEPGGHAGGTHLVARQYDFLQLGKSQGVPMLMMANEHFGRVTRLLDGGVPVRLSLDVRTSFHEDNRVSANVIADLPGTDLKDEIVMLGAHLDSWHGGTGATDDAGGVAAAMDAMRLLKAVGAKPRRTIRLALWNGEEQGLLGSRAYASAHLGHRDEPEDPALRVLPFFWRPLVGKLHTKTDLAHFDAYFDLDCGTGRIRGIYLQGNTAAAPLVKSWLAPLADLGVAVASPRSLVGADHQTFQSLGVPAFIFLQDELGYFTDTHHTNMDVFERLEHDDLVQASVVAAWIVYQAATSDERVPRPTLPNGRP